jgi:hypothetical protein
LIGTVCRANNNTAIGIRNLGSFIQTGSLDIFYGNGTSTNAITLNNFAGTTIFQVYIDDFTTGITCDESSSYGLQDEDFITFNSTPTDIFKPLSTRNAEFRVTVGDAVEKEAMGYDVSGDFLYDELSEVKRIGTSASNYSQFGTDGSITQAGTAMFFPLQATTAGAPAYVKGALYFDTTLNKLRVGGATAWETITSI